MPLVELRARSLPGEAETLVTCPDATPEDGLWSCAWDAGDLSGLSGYELCARGTDSLGNVGGWMGCVSLVVDDTPPAVVLDASFYHGTPSLVEQLLAVALPTPAVQRRQRCAL